MILAFAIAYHELASRLAGGLNDKGREIVSRTLARVAAEKARALDWKRAKFANLAQSIHEQANALTVDGGEVGPPLGPNPPDCFLEFRVRAQAEALAERVASDPYEGDEPEAIISGLLWGAIMLDFRSNGALTVDAAVLLFGEQAKDPES